MRFDELSLDFKKLEETASRNAMTEQLSVLYGEVAEDEIAKVCYLSLGRLAPLYKRVEFNLADKMVVRAIARAFGMKIEEVQKMYKEIGDLGEVGSKLKIESEDRQLSVTQVFDSLIDIAHEGGQGSQERKIVGLSELLKSLDELSVKYVVRMVLGRLRLGFSDKTILDALSVMETGSKSAKSELELAYQVFPDVGRLAELVKKFGVKGIEERVSVTMGVPVLPALCQRLKTAEEMIKKMGEVMVEPKYDGTRVQIHFARQDESEELTDSSKDTVLLKTFTRNLDETTHMFPELAEGVKQLKADEVILDSEAVGIHPKTGELLPFQATITRKRKHGIEEASRQVPLIFFVFDVLYKDGESLLGKGLDERRKVLSELIGEGEVLSLAPVIVTKDPTKLRRYHGEQLGNGLEGAVIKKMKSKYVPGRRGWNWVKFKEVEEAEGKLADTLDLIVMGFYRGKGKRAKFGLGAFLVGLRSSEGKIKTVAKIGTGLTDDQWREMKQRLEVLVRVNKPKEYEVDKNLEPDVWVDPEVVVEVAADEITNSPNHSAGLALRFPRLIRFRDDKNTSQATSLEELETIRKVS